MKPFLTSSLLVIFIGLPSVVSSAQQVGPVDPSHADVASLNQNGKIFSVTLVPEKKIKFYVVGRKEAAFDFSNGTLEVRRLSPAPVKSVVISKQGDHFLSDELLEPGKPVEL